MSINSFDSIEDQLELREDEQPLYAMLVDSEKLKDWLLTTREGKAVDSEVKRRYEHAISKFVSCDLGDTEALNKAKIELEVSKQVYSIFSAIFQDGDQAEAMLTNKVD